MSQSFPGTISPTDTSGTELAALLTDWAAAINSNNAGASEPSYKAPGTIWLDTSVTAAWKLKLYDGTSWIILSTFNASTHLDTGFKLRRIRNFLSSTTYTPIDGNVRALIAIVLGGGGAGGGAQAAPSGQSSAGGGGGSGVYAQGLIITGFSSLAITIGAAGTGVSGGNGNAGGTTSLGSLISCPGGTGGGGSNPAVGPFWGGAGAGQTTAPTFDGAVQPLISLGNGGGKVGLRLSSDGVGGEGGSNPKGRGGAEKLGGGSGGTGPGNGANGSGAGGGGAVASNDGPYAGGAGSAGAVMIAEYE